MGLGTIFRVQNPRTANKPMLCKSAQTGPLCNLVGTGFMCILLLRLHWCYCTGTLRLHPSSQFYDDVGPDQGHGEGHDDGPDGGLVNGDNDGYDSGQDAFHID